MSKQDERLEEKLKNLEDGKQPEGSIAGSSNSSEIKSLVNLAASIRNLLHPEQDRQTVQTEKRRIISAAREKYRASQNNEATKSNGFTGQWLFVPAVAGVALIVLMVFVLAAGAGLYFSGPRGAQAATLTNATGVLEVSDTGFGRDWRLVSNGDELQSGQRLRTGDESWVTLEFFDGTNVTLNPNTDLVLSKVDGNWGDELLVELIQNGGETNHQVIPLQGNQASYRVFTPSGEASVKGTSFSVLVEETGISHFIVETGEVLVNNDSFETFVSAGQSVSTELGAPIASANYDFTLQGEIEAMSGKNWLVAGFSILVTDDTVVEGDPALGKFVEVNGRIKKKGDWLADTVDVLENPISPGGIYTGLVTEQGDPTWTIGGYTIDVSRLSLTGIVVGDLVRVSFTVENDTKYAHSIKLTTGDDEEDPDADEDDDLDSDEDQQGLVFKLDEYDKSACEVVPSPSFKLWYYTDSVDNITVKEFAYEILEGEDEGYIAADGVQFDPAGPYVITPNGSSEVVTVKITLLGDPAVLPPGGEVKIKVSPVVDPAIEGLEMEDLIIELKCAGKKEEKPKEGHYCTSTDDHPKGLELEGELYYDSAGNVVAVTYDQIMEWFCKYRFGFGEIDLMLGLSEQYKVDILYVFGLRQKEGYGWGQIKRRLAVEAEALQVDDELTIEETKKEPPGKQKSEDAKNKEKSNKKNKNDD